MRNVHLEAVRSLSIKRRRRPSLSRAEAEAAATALGQCARASDWHRGSNARASHARASKKARVCRRFHRVSTRAHTGRKRRSPSLSKEVWFHCGRNNSLVVIIVLICSCCEQLIRALSSITLSESGADGSKRRDNASQRQLALQGTLWSIG